MSNGIAERQNKDSNIAKLAAQKQLYRDVGWINRINLMLAVIIPLVLAIVQEIMVCWTWAKWVSCIVSIIIVLLSIHLSSTGKKETKLAATIQQEFDIDVYQMPWDRKLFGERRDYAEEIAVYSKTILANKQEKDLLYNWYTREVDSLPLIEGIAACQKVNFSWDAGLRKRYRKFLRVLLLLIISVLLVVSMVRNLPFQEVVIRLFIILPAIKWSVENIKDLSDDLNRMNSIEKAVFSQCEKNMEDLQFIQKEIFENRKVILKIPDWFYKKYRDNDEDRERRALEYRNMD